MLSVDDTKGADGRGVERDRVAGGLEGDGLARREENRRRKESIVGILALEDIVRELLGPGRVQESLKPLVVRIIWVERLNAIEARCEQIANLDCRREEGEGAL